MKKFAKAAVLAVTLAAIVPSLALAAPHHHRHKVCTMHHHHRVCVWRY